MDLKTKRLLIRKFRCEDIDALYKLLSNQSVMEYIGKPYSYNDCLIFMAKYALVDKPRVFAVEDRRYKFIGYIIYGDYAENAKEIGWLLLPEEQGKGYASELTQALLEYSALEKLEYVIIECVPENNISKKIAEKYQFDYLGIQNGLCLYKYTL